MKFDRNTIMGFVVMGVLLVGFLVFTSKERRAVEKDQKIQDSIRNSAQQQTVPKITDTLAYLRDSIYQDSIRNQAKAGDFKSARTGSEQLVYVHNDVFTIALTNKVGQPKWIELTNFKIMNSSRVRLASSSFDNISYKINTGGNNSEQVSNFYFQKIDSARNADGSTTISFTLQTDSGSASSIVHRYTIKPDDYMIDFDVQLKGADK